MKINFEVTEIRDATIGDARVSAYPPDTPVKILRITPVADVHAAACGDIILALSVPETAGIIAAIPETPIYGPEGKVTGHTERTPGTAVSLSIG